MKKFVHKLEGLIKYYSFLEYQAKIELGEVNKKIQKIQEDIGRYTQYSRDVLESNESFGLDSPITGSQVQMFPFVLTDMRKHIEYLKKEKEKLHPIYLEKLKNLNEKKSKLDLVLKIKDKDFLEYKKLLQQKEFQEILEIGVVNQFISKEDYEA